MTQIHSTSIIDPTAQIGDGTVIGPFCWVEGGAIVGENCHLDSHVTIKQGTTVGDRNQFAQGTVIGGDPQDRKFQGEPTFLRVGDDNVFREYVSISRATGEGMTTIIGNRNYIMANVHIGHNCVTMDDVTITNNTGVAGHVTIEEKVTIGGMVGVHQFVRIGKLAMVGGMSRIVRDVPPFMIVEGMEQIVHDINAVGLRRVHVTQEARLALHKACKLLFKSQLGLTNAIEIVHREVKMTDEVQYLIAFLERLFGGKNGRGDQH